MKLAYGLSVTCLSAWVAVVGCDDNRPIGDLGFAGMPDEGDGGTGASTSGGSDGKPEGGSDGKPEGGSPSGGQPGAGGAGGASNSECPADFFEADGTPCSIEGQICSDGADDPCGFGNSLLCVDGEWQRQEAFPAPCGGAGGGGAAGADAGGAGGSQ